MHSKYCVSAYSANHPMTFELGYGQLKIASKDGFLLETVEVSRTNRGGRLYIYIYIYQDKHRVAFSRFRARTLLPPAIQTSRSCVNGA